MCDMRTFGKAPALSESCASGERIMASVAPILLTPFSLPLSVTVHCSAYVSLISGIFLPCPIEIMYGKL